MQRLEREELLIDNLLWSADHGLGLVCSMFNLWDIPLKKGGDISSPKEIFKEYVKFLPIICQENFGGLKAYAQSFYQPPLHSLLRLGPLEFFSKGLWSKSEPRPIPSLNCRQISGLTLVRPPTDKSVFTLKESTKLKRLELPCFPNDYFNKGCPKIGLCIHLSAHIFRFLVKATFPKLSQRESHCWNV